MGAANLSWGRSAGFYIDADTITYTLGASSLTGRIVTDRASEKISDDGPAAALKKLIEDRIPEKQRKGISVCVGLSPHQTFFITAKTDFESNETATLDGMIDACRCSSTVDTESMVTNYFKACKSRQGANHYWSLAACGRGLAQSLLDTLMQAGFRDVSLRAAPWVIPAASSGRSPVKSWKTYLHLLLTEGSGIVILRMNGAAVLWRRFEFPSTQNPEIMTTGIRTILVHAVASLGNPAIDGIAIEGTGSEKLTETLGCDFQLPVELIEGGRFDNESVSQNLATSAKHNELIEFDLFEQLKPRPSILSIFPVRFAATLLIIAGAMSFMMYNKLDSINKQYLSLKKQNSSHSWSKAKRTGAIKSDRKDLLAEVEAMEIFISSRIVWSDYLRDIPTYIPSNACLSNLWCFNEMKSISKKDTGRRIKKSFTMRGMTQFPNGLAAPEEIETFIQTLREVELLKKEFPDVQLAEIKWRRDGDREIAMFTVIAMPKGSKKG